MVTLDDRLLGEKLQNYCSSSSDEEDEGGKIAEIQWEKFHDTVDLFLIKVTNPTMANAKNHRRNLFPKQN